jgi:hypothetical protein
MKNIFYLTIKGFLWLLPLMSVLPQAFSQDVLAEVIDESTNGANDGAIDLTLTGGYSPYEFSWKGPSRFMANTEDISGLKPGQYCVTITDNLCGTLSLCRIIKRCDPILAAGVTVKCPYNAGGTMNLYLNNSGPFVLNWNDGFTQNANNGLTVRNDLDIGSVYCVTVTNTAGCSESVCRLIQSPVGPMQITGSVMHPSCSQQQGSIVQSVMGGHAPYKYTWADNGTITTKDRSNLVPGTYCVTVTDDYGCTTTACYTINAFSSNVKVNLQAVKMLSDCEGQNCNAMIDINPSGGTSPYTFQWSMPNGGSSSQEDLNNLCKVGLYNVTVTDASGCSATKSIIICCCGNSNEPPTPVMCIPSTFTIQGTVIQASSTQGGSININFNPPSSDYGLYWQKNGQFFFKREKLNQSSARRLLCVY